MLKNFVNLEDEEDEEGGARKGEELEASHYEDGKNDCDPSSNREQVGTGTAIVIPSSSVETGGKGKETEEQQVVGNQGSLQRNEARSVSEDTEWKDDDGFEDVDIAAEEEKKGSMVSGQVGKDQNQDMEEKVVPSQVQQSSVAGRKENTATESKKRKKKKKKNSNSSVAVEQEKVSVAASEEVHKADTKDVKKIDPKEDEKEYAEMEKKIQELENIIKERESQLERKAAEVAEAKRVTDAVVKKNEELAMTQASISELDLENMRRYGF